MLLKKREMPIPLMQLQALIPRLSPDYPLLAKLKWDEKARLKGYEGERNIDYFIGLLADRFHILHDVCLTVNSLIVQIDSIIISNKAVYIIEMKNYSQKVIFDTKLNQFIQTDGKVDKGFNNPIMQAENQRLQLRMWLQQHGINIPIYFW
ncbi:nuclease-related domain-containing protein [Ornithinibacillus scapharcae]|uniref:nuclease-related domain-containing protein n=1 Tax=Ornithinibacillus scapharcae TaxID=1147159 RepID=UPI000225B9F1|nr:nuclease-related domain-containing protein [Ornithinibacillus scapharcae]